MVRSTADDYQGPSFPPKPPAERFSTYNVETLSMSASELDKKLKENLEQKAMEWYDISLRTKLDVWHVLGSNKNC